ncbi:MAG TPA: 2-C-methyl-D-erythritol 2,4-cyclodiphosphate synthase, partial [Cellvibrionaceae bacterium]|nr:2-C-methyl-D-erythritol 2,4-cyclodiphosphate synthase [Cellvibrionaceae bacterium]
RMVVAKVRAKGFKVVNADMTIIAQVPKMAPYIPRMLPLIAEDLAVAMDAVNVKATTTEQLGFTGRKEGIACLASVLVAQI